MMQQTDDVNTNLDDEVGEELGDEEEGLGMGMGDENDGAGLDDEEDQDLAA